MNKNCPLQAKNCGGCPLLSQEYAQQLETKRQTVKKLLACYAPIEPVRGMKDPWHYRNKAIATFAAGPGGRLVAGIYAAGTHRVLPAVDCLLQDETINQVIAAAAEAARRCHYEAFDEDRGTGLIRHVLVRRGFGTGEIMVVLVTAQEILPGAKNFVRALREEAVRRGAVVTTAVQNVNPRKTSAVLGPYDRILFGKGYILDTLSGHTFSIGPRSFYQVNPTQTEELYRLAIKAAALTGTQTVLDAYCGTGTIALTAAPFAKAVTGVEINEDAVKDAIANARHNRIANARFYAEDATSWIVQAAAEGRHADVVFLDPPREGSTPEFLRALARLAPQRVVYISCNPETQSRDLAVLTKLGYQAKRIWPVDMFPHTAHVETVVLMSRVENQP
ncbi:MAG: 23S rRNA (uracil(1939)-C(5))-methyltransferase RlmD [Faecalibacterium sp.]|jgi:23S rRNA (uracil1939-C5)-methyltransferase|nr:23S rRNA (uracil(1939)-C(5))-methyltransferase RlmD [Faecalibacterium sp.]